MVKATSKRLLLLNTNLAVGGAERQLLHVARHLEGWQTSVLLLEKQGLFCKDVPGGVGLRALSERAPVHPLPKLRWALGQVGALRRFLEQNPCDAVLTFLWLPTLLCAMALRGMKERPRLIWSVQSDLEEDFARRWLGGLRSYLVKRFIPGQAAYYIAISRGVAAKVTKVLGVPPSKIEVIPNAIDLGMIDRLKMEQPEGSCKAGAGRLRLISVGRLVPQKAHHDLIAAFAEARASVPAMELVILGEGPERKRLEELVSRLALEERVHLLGTVANPYAWLARADIFVLASAWEPFGIVLTEALAAGLPVITTATDGGREIIAAHAAGITVPIGDTAALGRAICELAASPEKRAELAREARRTARAFDAAVIVPKYAQVLNNVV